MIKLKEKKLILVGAGGHAKVILDIIDLNKKKVTAVFDLKDVLDVTFKKYIHIKTDQELSKKISYNKYDMVNGIGIIPGKNKEIRKKIFYKYKLLGFSFISIVHPSAVVSKIVKLGEGINIMAGCVIQAGTKIKHNTIINTGSTIDHDCEIGENVHIAPGVTICGNVKVGNNCFIGAGSTILPGAIIPEDKVIPSGLIVKN